MDPALWELIRSSADGDAREVEAIIRVDRPDVAVPGVRIVSRFGCIATCRVRLDSILAARRDPHVQSLKAPRLCGPELEHRGRTIGFGADRRRPPGLPLTGAGVIVGVIDWGCDFDHPNFTRRDGSTRLRALWDQRDGGSVGTPHRYGYGTVHGRAQIDEALATADPYHVLGYHPADVDRDGWGSHGSHVMDIAAGNGAAGGPVGIAPDAELVFVHLAHRGTSGLANLGDSVRILEAVDFIARAAGHRPWVINLSVGRCGGPHDGSTLTELALDAILGAGPGHFVVQSAGNYFSSATHASGRLKPGQVESLTFVTDAADFTPNELEVWYRGEDDLVVEITSPTGRVTSAVRLGDRVDVVENDWVVGRVYHRACDPNNHDNHIDLFLDPWAPAGQWTVTLRAQRIADGAFHAWLERDEACPSCQARFAQPDADTSCTTGTIANGHLPLVVGAYDAHSPTRALAPTSSAGPTRDGRFKPDLLAPGVHVLAARSAPAGSRQSPGLLVRKSGTSMAAPHVAGTVALCLQAGALAAEEIRAVLLQTAEPVIPHGDQTGCGYLDIARAVAAASTVRHRRARSRSYLLPDVPWRGPDPKETDMEPDLPHTTVAALGPARLYRELVYRPGEPLSSWIDARFLVLARPGEAPSARPAAGDLLVRVPLGEPGPGHVAVLSHPALTPHHMLNGSQLTTEREGPGTYALVIQDRAFPHCANDRYARRILDASGRMPPGQLLLRPRPAQAPERTLDEGLSEEQATDPLIGPLSDGEWVLVELWQSAGQVGSDHLTDNAARNAALIADAIFCGRRIGTPDQNDHPLLCIDPSVTSADPRVVALTRHVVARGEIINWASVSREQRRLRVMELLIDTYGYPVNGAAGLVGNLDAESKVLPNSIQGSRPATPMRGWNFRRVDTDFTATEIMNRNPATQRGPFHPGIGLAQWTRPNRRAGLFRHRHGTTPAGARILFNLPAQVDYLVTELQADFAGVNNTLTDPAVTINDASDDVVYHFEIPRSILDNGVRRPRTDPAVQAVFRGRRAMARTALNDYRAAHPAAAAPAGSPEAVTLPSRSTTDAEDATTDVGRELVSRFASGVRVAVYDPGTAELARRAAEWARREEAVGATGAMVDASGLALGVAMPDARGLVRTLTDLGQALAEATGTTTGPALVRTLALFAHGWGTTVAIGSGLTAGNVADVIARLAPVLTEDVNIVLYGCSVCAQADEGGWVATTMGSGGLDSLCAKVRDSLVDQGKTSATVWGHTEVGHTTRNWSLRRFRAARSLPDGGKRTPGAAYAGEIVFGTVKPGAVAKVEAAINAKGYRVVGSKQPEFASFVLGRLDRHFYRAYGEANRTKTHGGANLAERAPLYPDDVAEIIRAHWRDTYWVPSRIEPFASALISRLRSLKIVEPVAAGGAETASDGMDERAEPLQQQCGYFPPAGGAVISDRDLRDAIRVVTLGERLRWLNAAGTGLLQENVVDQFGHLVRYWLGSVREIRPSTLAHAQAMAIGGTINYQPLLVPGAAPAAIRAAAAAIRAALLAGAPMVGTPANLNALIDTALVNARNSRTGPAADRVFWSAVFVSDCIRRVAINHRLESDVGGVHQGQDVLLRTHRGHRFYVHEAHRRSLAPGQLDGTYHAFQPDERAVQIGDIIVQDRTRRINLAGVWRFADIPHIIRRGRSLHGDIVVDVSPDHVVAIGGNVGQSVRRRRYPLDARGRLVVARDERYTQETNNTALPALPDSDPGVGPILVSRSTARIFALLSLVESCVVIPGQQVNGTVLV